MRSVTTVSTALALFTAGALTLAACGSADRPGPAAPPGSTTAGSTTAANPAATSPAPATGRPRPVTLPPPNAPGDYQIGGAYRPPRGVRVLDRDRGAQPVKGLYNICYVNAFQAQPAELRWWRANHPDLLLKDRIGREIVDTQWHETLLDTSTPAKRAALTTIVGGWIDACAASGYQAVEPDNLDSYERSGGLLTSDQAIAYATALAARAHQDGLAIAQKNAVEIAALAHTRARLDFAITEACAQYDECAAYTAVYGSHVIDIEYEHPAYTRACTTAGRAVTVILRDVDVSAPDSETYEYATC